jgi:hypothetical protein
VTDDTAAINASITAQNYALIPPNVNVGVGTVFPNNIRLRSNQALIGSGPTSNLVVLSSFNAGGGGQFIALDGNDIEVRDFAVSSSIVNSVSDNVALIQNFDTGFGGSINRVRVSRVKFNLPTYNKGTVAFICTGQNISDLIIEDCDVQAAGSGLTVFSGNISGGGTCNNLIIVNNRLSNLFGASNYGIGVSISAKVTNALIANNSIGNVEYACMEMVGIGTNANFCDNILWGTGPRGFACTNANQSPSVIVQGNTTGTECNHFWEIASCPGAIIANNTIYGCVILDCSNIWAHDNHIVVPNGSVTSGFGLGNGSATVTNCLVENNILDSSNYTSSPNVVYCNGAGVTGNIIRNNLLKLSPQSGSYTASFNGASNNMFITNFHEINGQATVSDPLVMEGTSYQFTNGGSVVLDYNITNGVNTFSFLNNTDVYLQAALGQSPSLRIGAPVVAGTNQIRLGLNTNNNPMLAFADPSGSGNRDTYLLREGASTFSVNTSDGTVPGVATTLQLYNLSDTIPVTTNYERGVVGWITPPNVFTVGAQASGSGTLRPTNLIGANIVVGTAALATNANNGFLYIPTCAGTPTGTPTTFTGRVPMIYDTTNNKFYIYNGSWKGGTNPGTFT